MNVTCSKKIARRLTQLKLPLYAVRPQVLNWIEQTDFESESTHEMVFQTETFGACVLRITNTEADEFTISSVFRVDETMKELSEEVEQQLSEE